MVKTYGTYIKTKNIFSFNTFEEFKFSLSNRLNYFIGKPIDQNLKEITYCIMKSYLEEAVSNGFLNAKILKDWHIRSSHSFVLEFQEIQGVLNIKTLGGEFFFDFIERNWINPDEED